MASQVARRLVVYPHRDGGQAQFVDRAVPKEDRPWLATLLAWTQNHLGEELSVKRPAKQAGMSKRTLSRRFAEEAATSPIEWLIGLRLARAKQMLEKTARSVDEIAYDTGFGSAPTLRHHFRRRLNASPVAYRSHFGEIPAAKEPGLVFVSAAQSQRAKGLVDLRATRKLSRQNHVSDKSASGSGTVNALVAINSRIVASLTLWIV